MALQNGNKYDNLICMILRITVFQFYCSALKTINIKMEFNKTFVNFSSGSNIYFYGYCYLLVFLIGNKQNNFIKLLIN